MAVGLNPGTLVNIPKANGIISRYGAVHTPTPGEQLQYFFTHDVP